MSIKRYIAIGDVHGCRDEFQELLQIVNPGPEDQVIMIGDLINHGPDSHGALALARDVGAICLLGNHELRLLRYRQTGDAEILKKADRITIPLLTDEDWAHLEKMALHHYVPELNTVFVHAGFLPHQPWEDQPAEVITDIQVVDELGRARRRAQNKLAPHWSRLWKGPPFVVYGHTPRSQYSRLTWSIGIDTSCVLGGALSAYILPDDQIVQVKARRPYA